MLSEKRFKHVVIKDSLFKSCHKEIGVWFSKFDPNSCTSFLVSLQVTILKIVIFLNNYCKFTQTFVEYDIAGRASK